MPGASTMPMLRAPLMPPDPNSPPIEDPGLRRMMKWVFIALVAVVALAILVVEVTLRWFGP